MGSVLPKKYNLVLFLGLTLLYPVAGFLIGEPFTEPTLVDMIGMPTVILFFGNIGHYVRSQSDGSGIVDERDVQNIDLALAGTGVILLGSIVAIYVGYATTSDMVPTEINYLALVGVVTLFLVLGGTELHQRL